MGMITNFAPFVLLVLAGLLGWRVLARRRQEKLHRAAQQRHDAAARANDVARYARRRDAD